MKSRFWLAGLLSVIAFGAALAADLPPLSGRTPVRGDFVQPVTLPPRHELAVRGENTALAPVTLVLRLDDLRSGDYASRVNDERVVPPGPFVLRWPTDGFKTPSGRRLDAAAVRRLIVFTGDGQPPLRIDGVTVEPGLTLPPDSLGLDFGPAGGPVFAGFEPVVIGDRRIEAGTPAAVARPGGDALVADGLRGVERFVQPWPNGRWTVTLWTEDLGEWETLPHPLERRIRVNGRTVLEERLSAPDWIARRYLAGRDAEAIPDFDPWRLYGARRGGRVSAEVTVDDGRLIVELAGDSPAATFLSGLLIEPAGAGVVEAVEAARAARFRETWRVAMPEPGPAVDALALGAAGPAVTPASRPGGAPTPLVLAPDTGGAFDLLAISPIDNAAPRLEVDMPAGLIVRWWSGAWRLERVGASSTLLRPSADALRARGMLPLAAGIPRRFVVRIDVPAGTPPGRYEGAVRLTAGDRVVRQPLVVEVPAVVLPEAEQPIGFYLEAPPQFDWFPETRALRRAAVACDLRTLRSFGLTGVAPPLATPDAAGLPDFVADMAAASAAGFHEPVLAYAPAKRLAAGEAAPRIALAEAELATHGLAPPVWSIADEPGNPGRPDPGFAPLSRAVRAVSPEVRRAAHLNRPDDAAFLPLVDVALINPGFGIDGDDLARVRRAGVSPWLYNTGAPRFTAGFYLWRTEADAYLQWHARMPTADPFDPTDGREADIAVLGASAEACPAHPDIDAALLAMAEGIVDRRWLAWLDRRRGAGAQALRRRLAAEVPARWPAAGPPPDAALERWRQHVHPLAREPE